VDKPFKNLPWSGKKAKTMIKEGFFFDDKFKVRFHGSPDSPLRKIAFASILYVAVNFYQEANV